MYLQAETSPFGKQSTPLAVRGRLKWYDHIKGFGFVVPEKVDRDIFLHMETLRSCGLSEVHQNDTLIVRFGDGPKGLVVTEICDRSGDKTQSCYLKPGH